MTTWCRDWMVALPNRRHTRESSWRFIPGGCILCRARWLSTNWLTRAFSAATDYELPTTDYELPVVFAWQVRACSVHRILSRLRLREDVLFVVGKPGSRGDAAIIMRR